MKIKKYLVAALAAAFTFSAQADEGMWLVRTFRDVAASADEAAEFHRYDEETGSEAGSRRPL